MLIGIIGIGMGIAGIFLAKFFKEFAEKAKLAEEEKKRKKLNGGV